MPPPSFADEELAQILNAAPGKETADLARRLGRNPEVVGNVRRQLVGGSCPVRWQPCAACGEPLARRPGNAPLTHKRCFPAYRRAYLARWSAVNAETVRAASRRWIERHPERARQSRKAADARRRAKDPAATAAELDRLKQRNAADQERTAPLARNGGTRWTEAEDAAVLATLKRPAAEAALALGRTCQAVGTRRKVLRRRGRVP